MKIGSLPAVAMEQYNNNQVRARKAEAAQAKKTDSIDVSHASRLFSEALQAARETPEVRMDKVEAVRAQLASGTYRVDSAAIAARLMSGITGV